MDWEDAPALAKLDLHKYTRQGVKVLCGAGDRACSEKYIDALSTDDPSLEPFLTSLKTLWNNKSGELGNLELAVIFEDGKIKVTKAERS